MIETLNYKGRDASQRNQGRVALFSQRQDEMLQSLNHLIESTRSMKVQGLNNTISTFDESVSILQGRVQAAFGDRSETNIDIPGLSEQPLSDNETVAVKMSIIRSLKFETISSREFSIPRAHKKTFQWIFDAPPKGGNGKPLWSDFVQWLESEATHPYWITGKPGAGKSTLMRCLVQKDTLQHHLSKWAAGIPTLLACFYSWNSGTTLQRTREGMLRTIIHQYLSQKPDLISTVLPKRFKLLHNFNLLGANIPLPDWELPELVDTLYAIIAMSGSSFKLVLIIDGLDEFEEDHSGLIELVQKINESGSVKLCVSSRPWNVFKDAFDDCPHLKLEHLTRKDMEAFVWHSFKKNRGFRELETGYPTHAEKLRRDIVDKATGVFLWVDLVVKTLLGQMTEGASFSELQAVLDDLPDDLSELYERIWRRIEPKYRGEACKIIRILEITKRDDVWLTLQLVWLCHPDCTLLNTDLKSLSNEAFQASLTQTVRRLKSRAKDLLEIPDLYGSATGMGVDYLHRTARDWILEKQNWQRVLDQSPPDCDPSKTLLKAMTIQLEPGDPRFSMGPGEFKDFGSTYFSSMLKCVREAKVGTDLGLYDCLDRLEVVMKQGIIPCWLSGGRNKKACRNCFACFCACIPLPDYVKYKLRISSTSHIYEKLDAVAGTMYHSVLFCAALGLDTYVEWKPKNIRTQYDKERSVHPC